MIDLRCSLDFGDANVGPIGGKDERSTGPVAAR
jgi:hypothetical protein